MKKLLFLFVAVAVFSVAILVWAHDSFVSSYPLQMNEKIEGGAASVMECNDCNVIMISLSNVSAEHMSLYGYERVTTPNLDAWAKDAIVFNNAFTQSSWTLPVGVSLFTSLYPYAHGVMDRHENNVLSENINTLPEILKENGYATAAFTGGLDYNEVFGHMRGFDTVVEEGEEVGWPTDFAGFRTAFLRAQEWLEKNEKNKFFLFVHGYDAHCPFVPPEKFAGVFSKNKNDITIDASQCLRGYQNNETEAYEAYYSISGKTMLTEDDMQYLEDSYDEEILSVDDLTVNFLQNIEKQVLDKTIIIVFSDHGEMFAKHGRFGRAGAVRGTLYDDVLHIPLLIKIPEQRGRRTDALVEVVDIMPTLLNVLNIRTDAVIQGKNTLLLSEGEQNTDTFVFSGSEFNTELVSAAYKQKSVNETVRSYDWKLIREAKLFDSGGIKEETFELYDIKNDKDELRNVVSEHTEIVEKLKSVLNGWAVESKKIRSEGKTGKIPDELSEEARKRGYW